jgi:hypothetical protein
MMAHTQQGTARIGFTTSHYLLLDADRHTEKSVVQWTRAYAKRHRSGSALIMMTSNRGELNLYGDRLYHFCIVFGRFIKQWQVVMRHIGNASNDGIVDGQFVKTKELNKWINERVNKKSNTVGHPRIFCYIPSRKDTPEDREGVFAYLRFWRDNRESELDFEEAYRKLSEQRRKRELLLGMKRYDDAVELESYQDKGVTDVYERDVMRELEKYVIANMEMKWELRS